MICRLVSGSGGGSEVGWRGDKTHPCWVWPNINPARKAFSSILVSTWTLKVMSQAKGLVGGAAHAARSGPP